MSEELYQYINLACLSVCLYPINDKTAKPIRPKFCVGPHVSPGKVYEWSTFQIFVSIKIRFSLNFWKFWKSIKLSVKIHELFFVLFYDVHKENMFTIIIERPIICIYFNMMLFEKKLIIDFFFFCFKIFVCRMEYNKLSLESFQSVLLERFH